MMFLHQCGLLLSIRRRWKLINRRMYLIRQKFTLSQLMMKCCGRTLRVVSHLERLVGMEFKGKLLLLLARLRDATIVCGDFH